MASTLKQGEDKLSRVIEQDLAEGVVSRAGTLFFTWSFVSALYGILSIDIFRQKIPDLSMWDNVWPRALFTSLPVFLVGMIYKKAHQHTKLKSYLTIVLLPGFLMAASLIHAWPLFWGGDYDFYLQFHASNILAMTTGIFFLSASPRMVLAQNLGFIVIYFGPLLYLFSGHRFELAKIIVSDTVLVTIILGITTQSIHKLRMKLAIEDHQRRKKASLFLGKKLADAIYHSSSMVLDDFTREGLVMSVDLRGYTKFMQSAERSTL